MDKKRSKKQVEKKDPRKQIRVAEDATSKQAKDGNKAYMEQMMAYQYDEN